MNSRRVTYRTLWLVSRREKKGRQLNLTDSMLLIGTNGAGKSRITKGLAWVLGGEPPKLFRGTWDEQIIGGLSFTVGQAEYLALRHGDMLGLFRGDELLCATRKRSEWHSCLGDALGFYLELQRPSTTTFSRAGIEYLSLPTYIDQDGGWGSGWDSHATLKQFRNWQKPFFELYLGIRPNAFFREKKKVDELSGCVQEKRRAFEAQQAAFDRVEAALPQDVPALAIGQFEDELAQLASAATQAYAKQSRVRAQLLDLISERSRIQTDLKLAGEAYKELVSDVVYMSEMDEGAIECPTCGTRHENSFHGRLALTQDAETMSSLLADLENQAATLGAKESKLRHGLQEVEAELADIDRSTAERKANIALSEVLAAHSRRTLSHAFHEVADSLADELEVLEMQLAEHRGRLKKFEDRSRMKAVAAYYVSEIEALSSKLGVPVHERVVQAKPGQRAGAGGSVFPRANLAVHLASIKTNIQYGDSARLPLVVDTPQQSGQVEDNLLKMIEVATKAVEGEHQVIIATEAVPGGLDLSLYQVIEFRGGALCSEEYESAFEALRKPYGRMKEAASRSELARLPPAS
jgi:chaperonin cofactor prefoldin